jgi:hypothetical protein
MKVDTSQSSGARREQSRRDKAIPEDFSLRGKYRGKYRDTSHILLDVESPMR